MFDLYKLAKSKSPSRTVIQNNSADSSAIRSLLEEQKKQRQLERSLEPIKRGLEIMPPPKPRTTFRYSAISKTTSAIDFTRTCLKLYPQEIQGVFSEATHLTLFLSRRHL